MNIDSNTAIICLTQNGKKLACKMKSLMNDGDIYFIQNKKDESSKENSSKTIQVNIEDNIEIYTVHKRIKLFVGDIFDKYNYIVFIMATGIVIRTIAHLVTSKFSDPAILVTDEMGTNVISLLSGHMGGANEKTLYISNLLHANPVITTATDVNKKSSLDMIAKKLDGYIENFRDNVKDINAMLVNNEPVGLYIDGDYDIDTRGFNVIGSLEELSDCYSSNETNRNKFEKIVVITNKNKLNSDKLEISISFESDKLIKLVPKDIVVGIGCRRDIDSHLLKDSLQDFLENNNIDINAIRKIGSIEVKKDEKAIIDLSKYLGVTFKTLSAEDISKVDYLFDKSEWVKKNVGVYSVAEPVAHILSGGNLIIEKNKYKGITFSVGRAKI
ncbi:cobalt-precorrin 5A hydrolase [Romboutsia weinsteinii]|uniref:Cobalt-precorrin 5A hydrolase n=1 Tax=Romboutsia weinsteinii TaxID=2020949 RepID=A0A371IZ79_9FIRM|nr:cobalt-precorrin 5A hydrolase [Romboutsia weinsteinii]RDY25789.1 cobalt-precorrin 5A hydrolase [Romboutsia weinsteinii]